MKTTLSTTMTLATLLGLGLLANFANAGESKDPANRIDHKSVLVHFGDLDPAVPADASILLERVRHAVDTACSRNDETRQIFLADDRAECIAEGYAKAIAGINRKRHIDLEAIAAADQAGANLEAAAR